QFLEKNRHHGSTDSPDGPTRTSQSTEAEAASARAMRPCLKIFLNPGMGDLQSLASCYLGLARRLTHRKGCKTNRQVAALEMIGRRRLTSESRFKRCRNPAKGKL